MNARREWLSVDGIDLGVVDRGGLCAEDFERHFVDEARVPIGD